MEQESATNPNSPLNRPISTPPRRTDSNLIYVGLILGVVALLLAASSLGVALARKGAPGAPGATGLNGGVVTIYDRHAMPIGTTCQSYTGSSVSILADGPGSIVVTATVLIVSHPNNYTDFEISLANESRACDVYKNDYVNGTSQFAPGEANYSSDAYVPLVQFFPVNVSGPYSVDVIGVAETPDGGTVTFYSASVVAEFFPS